MKLRNSILGRRTLFTTLIAISAILAEISRTVPNVEAKEPPPIIQTIQFKDETERIKNLIARKAYEHNVNPDMAVFLAQIESNFNPKARNPRSTAKGIYQWLDGSWRSFCEGEVFNPEDNVDCAMRVIGEGGISHWLADPLTKQRLISAGYIE